jgi:hypothetical protein
VPTAEQSYGLPEEALAQWREEHPEG